MELWLIRIEISVFRSWSQCTALALAHHRSISSHVTVTVIDILLSRPRDDDG